MLDLWLSLPHYPGCGYSNHYALLWSLIAVACPHGFDDDVTCFRSPGDLIGRSMVTFPAQLRLPYQKAKKQTPQQSILDDMFLGNSLLIVELRIKPTLIKTFVGSNPQLGLPQKIGSRKKNQLFLRACPMNIAIK